MTIKSKIGNKLRQYTPLNHRTFDLVRFELGCRVERLRNKLSPQYRRVIRQLQSQHSLSLNIGSGGRGKPGWINIDARPSHQDIMFTHDIRNPFPLSDRTVKRIFAEHIIEHLDVRYEVPGVLSEFYRLLESNGVLRIIVPDAPRYMKAYLSKDWNLWESLGWYKDRWPHDILTPMHAINHVFHQNGEHYFGYDFETLHLLLAQAGFKRIEKMIYGESVDPELAIDRLEHSIYSLYVDAVK